jgi:murein L,D-transpeptidase YcbB/YkuD
MFQKHHGLEPDGRLGKNTLEALNQTTAHRYNILVLNLDRLRKLGPAAKRMLWVNIPAYKLKVFEENHLHDTYKVIVGKPKTPTPMLESAVIRVITNPVWLVPPAITRKEMMPKIKADSNYMKRNRLRVVDSRNQPVDMRDVDPGLLASGASGYRIRQDAGSDNALGRVKFIFPNAYSVYLHDTPSKTLFTKDIRALSHGCVRVQNPEKLADYLTQPGYTGTVPVSDLIAGGKRREIGLQDSIPIRITYITCEGDESGAFFYRDIYSRDTQEMEALAIAD